MTDESLHLRRGGTSVVALLPTDGPPVILHWGPDLGEDGHAGIMAAAVRPVGGSVIDSTPLVPVLPMLSDGWLGRPGLVGSRPGGRAWAPTFTAATHTVQEAGCAEWPDGPTGGVRLVSVAADELLALTVTSELEMHPSGLIRLRATVRNDAAEPYRLDVLEPALPVPPDADEVLDFAGRWSHERAPQRASFRQGAWVRESRGGRPGHDNAFLLIAGHHGFGYRRGFAWGAHVAWSGNQVIAAELSPSGVRHLRGGELLEPDEVVLSAGESYASPWLVASWGDGLDALAARFHRFLRARPTHPAGPRPVTFNSWEAVYFDHDLDRLRELARAAAALGVERFVLDDGWFTGRRDVTAGLGDWTVDAQVWPEGLTPIAEAVHDLGMEFGLWFEPEMINPNSDLARAHPEWVFGTEHGPGVEGRNQHVLDLGHPEAYAHIRNAMVELIGRYGIDYIKWDHNRPLTAAGHSPSHAPGVHRHTLAVYRLIDELKAQFPHLEIESCASGGARADLGIMERCDRVWASDSNDAHERERINRNTGLLLPPELLGTHIGSGRDHITGRRLDLTMRAGTAIWGHLGIEWDLAAAPPEELAELASWVAFSKEWRALLHSGDVVHADCPDSAVALEGVVDAARDRALYRYTLLDHPLIAPVGPLRLPGLDPSRSYRVSVAGPSAPSGSTRDLPAWCAGVDVSGAVLGAVGLIMPPVAVDGVVLIQVEGR